jgi:hypothetical protein
MITAYGNTEDMYQARGLLMAVWMSFSVMMLIGALRTNVCLAVTCTYCYKSVRGILPNASTVLAVVVTFMLQCIGYLTMNEAALVGSGESKWDCDAASPSPAALGHLDIAHSNKQAGPVSSRPGWPITSAVRRCMPSRAFPSRFL